MSANSKITVIIPVYNTERYLVECLESIINQTLRDINIICINDGSTDDSLKILEDHAKKDSRITLVTQENNGLSATRNRGLELVETPYVYFMDSDDILELNALEYLCKEMELNKLDILYFDGVAAYENDEVKKMFPEYYTTYTYSRTEELGKIYTGIELMTEFQRINSYRVSMCLQMLSVEFLKRNNFKFYEGIFHEDQLFTFSTMILAERVSHRKRELFHRRVRSGSIMTQDASMAHTRGYLVAYI